MVTGCSGWIRKQILYRLCDSGMYEQRNEKLIQQATTIKMEVTHPNTLPNVACAQSSEQAKQTGRQTQAGKQVDTGRQAVRLAGKHIGRLEAI